MKSMMTWRRLLTITMLLSWLVLAIVVSRLVCVFAPNVPPWYLLSTASVGIAFVAVTFVDAVQSRRVVGKSVIWLIPVAFAFNIAWVGFYWGFQVWREVRESVHKEQGTKLQAEPPGQHREGP